MDWILSLIGLTTGIVPFIEFRSIKINFDNIKIEFFKPVAEKVHWTEDNYMNNPIMYRLECKIRTYNGKKKISGINNCEFELKFLNGLAVEDSINENMFGEMLNIEPGGCKETNIKQQGTILFDDNLKYGYSLNFYYTVNGNDKRKKIVVKKVKGIKKSK